MSSNGGTRVLRITMTSLGSGSTCVRAACWVRSSRSRPGGTPSGIASASPRRTASIWRDFGTSSLQLDPVGIPVGLRGLRPLAEVRVASEHVAVTGLRRGHHVGAGGRHRLHVRRTQRRPFRQDEGEGQRELVEELGIRTGEMEGDDRVALGDDAAREVARRRLARALLRAGDRRRGSRVPPTSPRGTRELPQPLEGVPDVPGPDHGAGRVADARSQHEAVRAPAVLGRRERDREVGHDLGAVAPGDVLQGDEAVAGHLHERRSIDVL